jgi:cyclopropane fatty-acyl-phospholipid synthase-like methyltransferase
MVAAFAGTPRDPKLDMAELEAVEEHFEKVTAGFPSPRTFLDIGCATGRLLQWDAGAGLGPRR